MNINPEVSNYISQADETQIPLLERIRQIIHKSVPGTTEALKWKMPVFAKKKDYSYMRFSKKHITLGFYHPEKIVDPDNMMEGEGKTMRHIKITQLDKNLEKRIANWLKQITA